LNFGAYWPLASLKARRGNLAKDEAHSDCQYNAVTTHREEDSALPVIYKAISQSEIAMVVPIRLMNKKNATSSSKN
jgi:hypothetical protein